MIDVVICGNVRSEVGLYEIVREVDRARARGVVGNVVLSTWNSEAERFPRLFEALTSAGIHVVSTNPPAPYTGSLQIQHLQFWRGLQALDSKPGWVFRTRTDKAFLQTAQFFDAVQAGRLRVDADTLPSQIFERKIYFNGISLNEAFPHNDITFLAWKADCRRILNFDAAFDYVLNEPGDLSVESRWVLAPIMARYPQLKGLLEAVDMQRFSRALREAAIRSELATISDDLLHFLVAYWRLTADLFGLIDRNPHSPLPAIEDIIAGRVSRPCAIHWGHRALVTSQHYLSAIGSGQLQNDPMWRRLEPHYLAAADVGDALDVLDPEDVRIFSDKYLPPAQPLKNRAQHYPPKSAPGAGVAHVFEGVLRVEMDGARAGSMRVLIEAAIDKDRATGGGHVSILQLGKQLAIESRAANDFGKAQYAFMCLLCAAWGRLPEAVHVLCELVFDGFVTKAQREEAFQTVYTIWVSNQNDPIGKFWYGVHHIYRFAGGGSGEFGRKLVEEAAALGLPQAIRYLAGGWEPAEPFA